MLTDGNILGTGLLATSSQPKPSRRVPEQKRACEKQRVVSDLRAKDGRRQTRTDEVGCEAY
jgi:hypothetical protein